MQIVASKSLLYALGFKNFGLTIIVAPMIMNEAKKMKSAMEGIRFTVVVLIDRMLADNNVLACEAVNRSYATCVVLVVRDLMTLDGSRVGVRVISTSEKDKARNKRIITLSSTQALR